MSALKDHFQDATLYDSISSCKPIFWQNPQHNSELAHLPLSVKDLNEARERWERLAPLLSQLFPQDAPEGRIASPLVPLSLPLGLGKSARALLKADSDLPVCASVKARGGLYEVFARAEQVALERGLLNRTDDYRQLASPALIEALAEEEVAVGSTGNLGMSVGLAAARLGMKATVHMSTDAKEWKKQLLRSRGVCVVEHSGQYAEAVAAGRKLADANPHCHFIDDEQSKTLFLGYSAAAKELKDQLDEQGIAVTPSEPLVVYIPCGVGGAPGGICWGLKHQFGDNVYVYFAEPTHAPCVTVGLATGLHDKVCVQDFGIDGKTEADGLAVGRPSGLVCQVVAGLVAGTFTVDDEELFEPLAELMDTHGRFMEPSCCAALLGPERLATHPQASKQLQCGTHVFWATGGALVPESERDVFYQRGKVNRTAPSRHHSRM